MDDPESAPGLLLDWLRATHGGSVTLREPPTTRGEGFDSAIHLVHVAGDRLPEPWRAPLVLRVKSDAGRLEEARREAAIQDWVADRGYPTPRVLHVFAPGELLDRPAQVMERAPGSLMVDRLLRGPWRARRLVSLLASLHATLHALPSDGFPATDDLLDRRLALTRRTAEVLDDGPLRRGLDQIQSLAGDLRGAPASVCHGDFHPLNVLVSGAGASVIDWTDAGVGDHHGDVARTRLLFEVAWIAAPNQALRAVLRRAGPLLGRAYHRAYGRHAPVDDRRIALWTPVHLLHGWSQVRGLHAGAFDDAPADDDRAERVPPGLADELRRRFDTALAAVQ